MSKKLQLVGNTPEGVEMYSFYCPGCEQDHAVWIKNINGRHQWKWDGDLEKPTVSPSIKVTGFNWKIKKDFICHLYIRQGKIQYLGDCTHQLAGKTIEMETIEE